MAQQFTNQAQLSFNNTVISSNVAVGEIRDVLSLEKTALQATYTVGDHLTYAVSMTNSGAAPLTDLTLTDDLGTFTDDTGTYTPLTFTEGTLRYFQNGVEQPLTPVEKAVPLTVNGLTVPAGGNVLILYEATVNGLANPTDGSSITNTVTVSGTGIAPLTASYTVTVTSGPVLSINKTISPVPVAQNGTVTYTFVIENAGNADATESDSLSITDTFNPLLSDLVVTYNGNTWEETTNYTYDAVTGLFTTVPGGITVPAATFTRGTDGTWGVTPGSATVTVSGTI